MPQSPTYWSDRMCVVHTYAHPHIFSTHRAHVAFPVNVRFSRRRGRCGGKGGGVSWWQRGGRGETKRRGRYTHRSLPPPWLSPTRPPHAKSPFVAHDGKLLFVRRLRGEFSDDETRSFRTRYGSGSRYRRKSQSRSRPSLSTAIFAKTNVL